MSWFAFVTDEEIENVCDEKDAAAMKKLTNIMFNVLIAYCMEREIDLQPETVSKFELDNILTKFYVEVRKSDCQMYKKTSFYALRFAI